jgi:hypothetical protein
VAGLLEEIARYLTSHQIPDSDDYGVYAPMGSKSIRLLRSVFSARIPPAPSNDDEILEP